MPLSKREEGRLTVEQARDLAVVRAILAENAMTTDGVGWASGCYLVAYFGHEPVGVVGLEPMLDAALMRSLCVAASMRRRGVGAALVGAARKAAHTRGVRALYAFGCGAGDYLRRLGFSEVPMPQLIAALAGTPGVRLRQARPERLSDETAFFLDISQDGIIAR
jgi:amino-acid N-acetyltransferase